MTLALLRIKVLELVGFGEVSPEELLESQPLFTSQVVRSFCLLVTADLLDYRGRHIKTKGEAERYFAIITNSNLQSHTILERYGHKILPEATAVIIRPDHIS